MNTKTNRATQSRSSNPGCGCNKQPNPGAVLAADCPLGWKVAANGNCYPPSFPPGPTGRNHFWSWRRTAPHGWILVPRQGILNELGQHPTLKSTTNATYVVAWTPKGKTSWYLVHRGPASASATYQQTSPKPHPGPHPVPVPWPGASGPTTMNDLCPPNTYFNGKYCVPTPQQGNPIKRPMGAASWPRSNPMQSGHPPVLPPTNQPCSASQIRSGCQNGSDSGGNTKCICPVTNRVKQSASRARAKTSNPGCTSCMGKMAWMPR